MANGITIPADDTNVAMAPTPSFVDRLWAKVLQAKKMGFAPADVDAYVREHSNGQLKSVVDLTRAQATSARALGAADVSRGPGRALTFMSHLADQAGLGIANKMDVALQQPETPLPASAAGLGIPTGQPGGDASLRQPGDLGVHSLLEEGAGAHPYTALAGEMAGAMAPGAVGGMAAEKAALPYLYKIPGLAKLFPGLLKFGARGAVGGAAASTLGSYGSSQDITPHPTDLVTAAAAGAIIGFPLGVIGGWGSMKLEPGEHLLGESVQKTATGEIPSYKAGKGALVEGTVSPQPVGPPAKQVTFTPESEAQYQQRPEILRPFNAEKSADLRGTASKELTKSFQVSTQMRNAVRDRMAALQDAVRSIERDPQTGYDATLGGKPITDEAALAIYRSQRGSMKTPDAADIYDLFKDMRDEIRDASLARQAGNKPSLRGMKLVDAAKARDVLSDALEPVPGFRELQGRVAPYMQRGAELRAFERGMIGRAIKPVGKAETAPKGGLLEEGIPETFGYKPTQIEERASRAMFKPLFSTNLHDLFHFIESEPEYRQFIPAAARELGAFGGAAYGATQNR
jgi:hypothetical protein